MNKEYFISEIESEDLKEALCLVWRVFLEYEAPDYVDEGIQEFKDFIAYDSIKQKLMENQFRMWVCRDKRKIIGVLATRPPCHISLLFVEGEYHRKGIASAMLSIMVDYYKAYHDHKEITVNSSPYAKEAYRRLGFNEIDIEQTVNGIRFIPMKRPL
ncbi:MAG: GNAT family N-acetyltransferase [Clostridiales bacterium]|nr:GNAT family N-acetyltransferase [Clostridiales bacterium]